MHPDYMAPPLSSVILSTECVTALLMFSYIGCLPWGSQAIVKGKSGMQRAEQHMDAAAEPITACTQYTQPSSIILHTTACMQYDKSVQCSKMS